MNLVIGHQNNHPLFMKKLNNEQKKELERLKDWSLIILENIKKNVSEHDKLYPIFLKFFDVVHYAFVVEDLRGMRLMVQDLTSWGKQMDKAQVAELNQILRNKFGEDLNYNLKKIEKIISKGIIEKLSEYKLLSDYSEEIYDDELKKDEAKKVNNLLEVYQTKTGKI